MNLPDGGLRTIPDLRERLWRQLERRYPGGIAAIFTHDEAGFYGHPDHLAVHDAIVPTAISREIPVITGALPDLLSEKFPIREPARSEGRRRAPITHALDFETEDYRVAVCSARAHTSQALLINSFMQFLGAERFYRNVPRTFLNLH